jgi:hypothetical protein
MLCTKVWVGQRLYSVSIGTWIEQRGKRRKNQKRIRDQGKGDIGIETYAKVRAVTGEIWTQKRDTLIVWKEGRTERQKVYEKGGREERE